MTAEPWYARIWANGRSDGANRFAMYLRLASGLLAYVVALTGDGRGRMVLWLTIGTVSCFLAATQYATLRRRARMTSATN